MHFKALRHYGCTPLKSQQESQTGCFLALKEIEISHNLRGRGSASELGNGRF